MNGVNMLLKSLKKLIISLSVLVLVIIVFVFIFINSNSSVANKSASLNDVTVKLNSFTPTSDKFIKYAENDKLILNVNEKTSEFSVTNKANGYTWYSLPQDRATNEEIIGEQINRARSLLTVNLVSKSNDPVQYTLFNDCLKNNQYEIDKIANGVAFKFILGIAEITIADLPSKIDMDKFNSRIISKLTIDDKIRIKGIYTASQMEKCMSLPTTINKKDATFVYNLLKKIGYTKQDIENDNKAFNVSVKKSKISVYVQVNITLDDNSIVVTIPTNNLFKSEDYAIDSIDFGEYFGAPEKNEKGYIVIPDGNGYLINISDSPKTNLTYTSDIYGLDINTTESESGSYAPGLSMPVFGIKRGSNAMVAVLENGAALSQEVVEPLNYNPYYKAFYRFKPDKFETSKVSEQKMLLFSKQNFNEPYVIRYSFLNGENISYVDMAKQVQKDLFDNKSSNITTNYGFSLDAICSIKKMQSVLGVPLYKDVTTTSYDNLLLMCTQLKDSGIKNMDLTIMGWLNGGLTHNNPAKSMAVSSELGGQDKLKSLLSSLKSININPFMDFSVQKVYDVPNDFTSMFYKKETFLAKDILGQISPKYELRYDTFVENKTYNPIYYSNPSTLNATLDNIIKISKDIGITNISYNDLAKETYSSGKGTSDFIDKNKYTKLVSEFLSNSDKNFKNISIQNNNFYALKYASDIKNIDYRGSNNIIFNESIPFLPLVLNGKVSYSYEPYNLSYDKTLLRLKIAETGADVYFKLSYNDQSIFKDTQFNNLYSTQYSLYKDDATKLYNELNTKLKDVKNSKIVNHEKLAENVFKTDFENGNSVITNYSVSDYKYKNIVVPKQDFVVNQGGE
jgi:hypothetical protein